MTTDIESSKPALKAAAGSLVGNFVSATPMVNAVFGLFLIPLATEFGWPRASVSLVLAIMAVVGLLSYPVVGRLADRHGVRRIVLVGNLMFAASVAALSLANGSLAQFYGLFVLVGVTAAVPSTVIMTKVVSGWFTRRRGLMLGLTAGLGNGAGATVMPIVCGLLLTHYGWRGAYLGLGAIIVLLGWPAMYWLLRDAPSAPSAPSAPGAPVASAGLVSPAANDESIAAGGTSPHAGMSLRQALRTPELWMVLVAVALGAGSMTAVFAHVIPMLMDRGVALGEATSVLVTFALVCVTWQVAIGYLLDRTSSPRIAAPFYLAALAGLVLFHQASGLGALLLAGALMGIGLGTEYGVLPYFVSRYFGLRAYGAIYGLVYGAVVLTMGVTPFLMDLVFDRSHSYDLAIYAIEAALVLGALLIARLRPYDVRRRSAQPASDPAATLSAAPSA